ncbi:MAG TPA: hypothetical protein VLL82_17510, partial [Mycobacterium sp.]|nr:hypothetical protein [Mycobacterium sp.]
LLKPGGYFIFSVPWSTKPETDEHFPRLHDYRIVDFGDERVLINRTKQGRYELYADLCFHGGEGTTLEMRVFCEAGLRSQLAQAGFVDVCLADDVPEFGILHKCRFNLPMMARKPWPATGR